MPVGFSEKIPPPSLETSIFPTGTVFHPPQFTSVQKLFGLLSKDTPDGIHLGAGEETRLLGLQAECSGPSSQPCGPNSPCVGSTSMASPGRGWSDEAGPEGSAAILGVLATRPPASSPASPILL